MLASIATAEDRLAEELDSFCKRVDAKLSSVNRGECLRLGLVDSGADSNEATPLWYRDFEPDEPVARVLLIGGIHGDEYSSVSIVFKWLAMLEENLGERFHWRVVPVLNPDGLLRPPRMSSRMNANGVDLNRNFPTPNWDEEAHEYWIKRTWKNKRRYPGPAALSEPETSWLVEQIESFQPHAVVAVHAPHGVVDFDGPRVPPRQLGPLELRLLGTYPGSMGRYIGVHRGIPLLTLELESAFGMPVYEEVHAIWYDMLGWLHEKIAIPLKLARESEAANDLIRVGPKPDNEG
ncbi:MAG: murein peptide amidase A [Gammaproteobacteria bacterium]|nr:murein peptide amidase A [Gammaproteobacteria bacterium]NNM21721.1 murein peptide amidase A [Gammaproteobacteria bacterium]